MTPVSTEALARFDLRLSRSAAVMQLMWILFIASIAGYTVAGTYFDYLGRLDEQSWYVPVIFGVLGLTTAMGTFYLYFGRFLNGRELRTAEGLIRVQHTWLGYHMACWSLNTLISVYGLIVTIITKDVILMLPFSGAALVMCLVMFPNHKRIVKRLKKIAVSGDSQMAASEAA